MSRPDWLNLVQVCLTGLQSLNFLLLMWHSNVYITGIIGVVIQCGANYMHLMGINTPAPGQLGPNQMVVNTEPPAK